MAEPAVTGTGTIKRVSPRARDVLPSDVQRRLVEAKTAHDKTVDDAREKLKIAVVAALAYGSVRQVAAAVGLSPTTVQHWSHGRDR